MKTVNLNIKRERKEDRKRDKEKKERRKEHFKGGKECGQKEREKIWLSYKIVKSYKIQEKRICHS